MNITLEPKDNSTIEAYSSSEVRINSIVYQQNIIVSSKKIITNWPVTAVSDLTDFIAQQPEIILIGHTQENQFTPHATIQALAKQHIALECMQLGAACRTFNVLLSEGRNVVLGVIF